MSASTRRKRTPPYESGPRVIQPFDKKLDGMLPFVGNPEALRAQNDAQANARFEELLEACQVIEGFGEVDKPDWDPPEIEDKVADLDVARDTLAGSYPASPAYDYEEARVWREMYEREYGRADALRQIAQKLDDAFDAKEENIEAHNEELQALSALARRLQLDLGV